MFIKQKSNIIFRNYKLFGYITDNRNFEYKRIENDTNHIGDKILSESGSVFMSVLSRTPQSMDEIGIKLKHFFSEIEIDILKNDAKEFYNSLEEEGFIVSGRTIEECENKDFKFSYKSHNPVLTKKEDVSLNNFSKKNTQDFIEEFFNGKPQLTNVHIEVTSMCNERCLHCYIPHENKITHINQDLFYNILEQCYTMNVLHLTLSGGEPLLHQNFCEFLKKCNEYNFSVNVLTNLTLLNDEIINEMKLNPLLGVQVSLYSMNPDIHDEITQVKGSFEKTISGILKLVENNIPLQISCPIMKQNKNSFKEVKEWANNQNIYVGDDYVIIAQYNHSTQNLFCRLSIDEIKKMINNDEHIEQIKTSAEKKKKYIPDDFVCSVCHSSVCISENGNVFPCAGWQDYIVGNIENTFLSEIWINSDKVNYLRNIRNRDFPTCIQCPDKEYCTMCMVRNANENQEGDPLIINEFFCKIAQLNRKLVQNFTK